MPDNTSSIIPIGGGGGGTAANVPFSGVTTGTNTVTLEMTGQVNISGPDATTNVEIGSTANDANAGTGGTSVVIGNGATNTNNVVGAVLIGSGAAIGINGSNVVGIGVGAIPSGGTNVVIGSNCSSGGFAGVVVLGGQAAAATANNQFIAGSTSTAINNAYFGKGPVSTSATAYTINGTAGSGADNAGGGINIAAGLGTGTAAGGDVRLQRSPSIATGSTAQTLADAYLVRSQKKALTDATATPFCRVNLAAGVAGVTGWTGGTVFYTVVANDASDYQSRSGSVNFAVVNKAGTETVVFGTVSAEAAALSAGTLTISLFDGDTSPANAVDLRITATSSLAETTLALFYSIILNGPGTLTPQ